MLTLHVCTFCSSTLPIFKLLSDGIGWLLTAEYWRPGMEGFRQYQDAAGTRVLKANTNTFQTVEHILTKVVIASKLRFVHM
jgi:hypothetical protein